VVRLGAHAGMSAMSLYTLSPESAEKPAPAETSRKSADITRRAARTATSSTVCRTASGFAVRALCGGWLARKCVSDSRAISARMPTT